MRARFAPLAVIAAVLCMGAASDPADRLTDPAQEARARSLFAEVRCLVCQNESIDDSDADLARDLRQIVREHVAKGDSDAEIRRFLTDRYGEFVLLKPSFSPGNAILWLSPFVVLAGGVLFLTRRLRKAAPETELSSEEKARLARLDDQGSG